MGALPNVSRTPKMTAINAGLKEIVWWLNPSYICTMESVETWPGNPAQSANAACNDMTAIANQIRLDIAFIPLPRK